MFYNFLVYLVIHINYTLDALSNKTSAMEYFIMLMLLFTAFVALLNLTSLSLNEE